MDDNFSNENATQETSTSGQGQQEFHYTYDESMPTQPGPLMNNTAQMNEQVEMEEPVKMSEWLLILAVCTFVPCVGLILLIIFAFSKREKKSKQNFCKAYLIIALIRLILTLIFVVVYSAAIYAFLVS